MASPLVAVRTPDRREAPKDDPATWHGAGLAATVPPAAALARSPRDRTAVGIGALLLSTLLFPMSDMLAKLLAERCSGLQVAWMRYLVLLVVVAPAIGRRPALVRTARPWLQLGRGSCNAMATALALLGFTVLPVADATAIAFSAPLVVIALAALILKEPVGAARWAAAAVGFAGILVIVQPSPGSFRAATLLPLCSSLFSACTIVSTRLLRDDRVETTVLLSALAGFGFLSVAVIPVWRPLDAAAMELGAIMGLLAAAASILQVVAYRCAPSSLLAPFSYAQILWAIGVGWLAFGTVPGPAMLVGSAVVVASGCAVALQAKPRMKRDWSALRRDLTRLDPSRRTRTV